MGAPHTREKILANVAKPRGSFWKTSQLAAKLLIGTRGEATDAQIARFIDHMFEGDPLADAVASWMLDVGVGRGRKAFELAVREGIAAVPDASEALRALFASVDAEPMWLDEALLLEGQRAVQRSGLLMPTILGDVTLVGGYLTMGAMNKSLVATGALEQGSSSRRLYETLGWWLDVTGDHGLDRDGPGFASTLHVRVMHALVRARVGADPTWRADEWGVPLSQAHLAATNQAFGVAFITLARAFGVRYSRREREAMMHLWRYAGFLMGVREDLCCATEREAFRLIAMSTATSPPPDEDAAKLAAGYLDAELDFRAVMPRAKAMQALGGALTWLATRSRIGTLRALLGPSDAAALALPPAGAAIVLPVLLAAATHASQVALAAVPGSRALEARVGRRIHLGMRAMSGFRGPVAYAPYEHREGADRLPVRPHA